MADSYVVCGTLQSQLHFFLIMVFFVCPSDYHGNDITTYPTVNFQRLW